MRLVRSATGISYTMISIKAFATSNTLTDNRVGITSTVGELSSYSRTFSRDVGDFTDNRWEDIHVMLFSSKNNGVPTPLSTVYSTHMLEVSKWIYDYASTASASITKNDFLVNLQNAFNATVNNPTCSDLINDSNFRIPEWVSWTLAGQSTTNTIKVWFADHAFRRDYDEYEIVVIPPVELVDTLFRPVQEVQAALALRNPTRMMELVNEARNGQPDTMLHAETLTYRTPGSTSLNIDTAWYCVIYGPAGNTPDVVRNAIKQYILANTFDVEDSWKTIIPDLFRATQMYVLPMWTKLAIPSRSTLVGIYSPIVSPQTAMSRAYSALPDLITAHVDDNLEVTHHKFRSLTLVVVGNADNKDAKYKLSDYVPDYIAESSNHQDFNRMSEFTKAWTIMMEELLMLAERYTASLSLPANVRRVTRQGITYLTRRIDAVDWMVAVKEA